MDYLAYFMIYLTVAFLALPLLAPRFSTYADGVKFSFCIQAAILIVLAFVFFITWPLKHLGWL